MTADTKKKDTRGHEHRFTLDGSPDQVWKAITEADELVNWFPFDARVEPGKGGSINYSWTPALENPCRIEIWEPGSHLRTSWMEPVAGDAEGNTVASIVDWYLEGAGGRTTLRLVHSGFGKSEDYDDEYDGTNRGWEFELRSLRHYLRHHRGTRRRMISAQQAVNVTADQVWQRLMGTDGLAPADGPAALKEGQPYRFRPAGGGEFHGEVLLDNPPLDFAGTVENLNNALFRVAYETCFGRPEAWIFISTWGLDDARVAQTETSVKGLLGKLFR